MSNYSSGHHAETVAREYLVEIGFDIIDQNWRNRYCEIDLVAKKNKTIYFIEVKYRLTNAQGRGLDYITIKKRKQMELASRFWINENKWDGQYTLAGVEVTGERFKISEFIFDI